MPRNLQCLYTGHGGENTFFAPYLQTDPKALATWLAPGQMTGQVHRFDLRVGGGYEMSLFYPPSEQASRGKTSAKEDRLTARYVEPTS